MSRVPTDVRNAKKPDRGSSWIWRHVRQGKQRGEVVGADGKTAVVWEKVFLCLPCIAVCKVQGGPTLSSYSSGSTTHVIHHLNKHGLTEEVFRKKAEQAGEKFATPTAKDKHVDGALLDGNRMMVVKCAMVCVKDLRPFTFSEGDGFGCACCLCAHRRARAASSASS